MTCISGPPWLPGNTEALIVFAWASRKRIIPPRGPRSVLCVVVVTNSQWGTGDGWMPAATRPAKWAMSAITVAPTSSAIARKGAKSIARGYAEWPTTSIFGRSRRARSRTGPRSIRPPDSRTPSLTMFSEAMSSRLSRCRSVSRPMAAKISGSVRSSAVAIYPVTCPLLVALDVVDDVPHGADLLRLLVRDLHVVLFLERHHELDDVERIGAEVLDEGRLRRHLLLAHAELLADDLPHLLLHARCHRAPPDLPLAPRAPHM